MSVVAFNTLVKYYSSVCRGTSIVFQLLALVGKDSLCLAYHFLRHMLSFSHAIYETFRIKCLVREFGLLYSKE
jgi:hypothetical protein